MYQEYDIMVLRKCTTYKLVFGIFLRGVLLAV